MLQYIIESIRDIISLFTVYLTFFLPLSIGYKELFNKYLLNTFDDKKEDDNKENKLDEKLWKKLVDEMLDESIDKNNISGGDSKCEDNSLMDILNEFNETNITKSEDVVETTT